MKIKKISLGTFSVILPLASLFIDIFFQKPFSYCTVIPDLSLGPAVLLTYPLSREDMKQSHRPVAAMLSAVLVCSFADLFIGRSGNCFTIFLQPMLLYIVLLYEAYDRFVLEAVKIKIPVPGNLHWYAVESKSRLFHISLPLITSSISASAFFAGKFLSVVLTVLSATLLSLVYTMLYRRVHTKRLYILGREEENRLRSCLERRLAPFEGDSLPDEKKDWFYNSIVNYMERDQPYLNPLFKKKDMAQALFSNVSYISRAINSNAGVEFRRFVNAYRIRYAVNAFREDPYLRVEQLALISGFNYQSTFNSAFQYVMHEKPSDWMRNYRATLLHK